MTRIIAFVLLFITLLCGCSNLSESKVNEISSLDQNEMENLERRSGSTLSEFFNLLSQGKYDRAAELFGGSYEVLQGYNPEIDPSNIAGLLEAGCKINGFMCLPILDLKLFQVNDLHEFIYEVTFKNPDGSAFELRPCCGANEEMMTVKNLFTIHVFCESQDVCYVMDLPPYVP